MIADYAKMAIKSKTQEELCFPRGNVEAKPVLASTNSNVIEKKVLKRKVEKDLFSNKEKSLVKKKKQKKQKEEGSIFEVKSVSILTYSSLSEGQILLGFVSQAG